MIYLHKFIFCHEEPSKQTYEFCNVYLINLEIIIVFMKFS